MRATDASRHDDARRIVDELEAKVAGDVDPGGTGTPGDDLRAAVPGSEEPPD